MTTTSIPLSALPPVGDKWRRDQWGRYLVLPPGGTKPVGYTRVTTVAKTLDGGYGLVPWKATLAICGAMMRRGLRARWEALMAETDDDPWYADDEGVAKEECKKLVEECAAVAGANDRREIGTALHAISVLVDMGREPASLTEETDRDLRAYLQGLAAAGVELIAGQAELTVVLDEFQVAGTFDRLARVPGFAKPLVADLKTGAKLDYSWHPIAVQLAAYAHGDNIYRQGPATDGSEDVRTPMPEVDQDNALVMWLNAGSGELELHLVDIAAGWEAFRLSMRARAWNKLDVAMPLEGGGFKRPTEDLAAALGASLEPNPLLSPFPIGDYQVTGAPPGTDGEVQPDYTTALRAWLQGRIDVIGAHEGARADLARTWPKDLPTLRAHPDHTSEQLAAMELLLNGVERRHKLPFPPDKPTTDAVGLVLHLFPNAVDVTDTESDPAS
jgi:hypothetical protein